MTRERQVNPGLEKIFNPFKGLSVNQKLTQLNPEQSKKIEQNKKRTKERKYVNYRNLVNASYDLGVLIKRREFLDNKFNNACKELAEGINIEENKKIIDESSKLLKQVEQDVDDKYEQIRKLVMEIDNVDLDVNIASLIKNSRDD